MAFKFTFLGLERKQDCNCDKDPTEKKKSKSKKPCLQDVLKACKGNKGKKWNQCLKEHGINKK